MAGNKSTKVNVSFFSCELVRILTFVDLKFLHSKYCFSKIFICLTKFDFFQSLVEKVSFNKFVDLLVEGLGLGEKYAVGAKKIIGM